VQEELVDYTASKDKDSKLYESSHNTHNDCELTKMKLRFLSSLSDSDVQFFLWRDHDSLDLENPLGQISCMRED